ncbi:MAG TPA: hypothetical protein VJV79_33805 [Polyangiaceae bacterium]|nr:hypothetical protein [Polyangiaceae bacterium]
MKSIVIGLYLGASTLPLACGNADQPAAPKSPSATNQTLSTVGACTFSACGSLPSNLASTPSVKCAGRSSDSCDWSASGADGSTSYRPCSSSECPPAPAIDCPNGSVHSSQQCGSENEAACAWTTVCVPPRDTTPCPDPDGCGAQTQIGVICNDGSNGAQVCVTNGQTCSWQRSCD